MERKNSEHNPGNPGRDSFDSVALTEVDATQKPRLIPVLSTSILSFFCCCCFAKNEDLSMTNEEPTHGCG